MAKDPVAGAVTEQAIDFLDQLFAGGPDVLGSMMAGRAEGLAGDAEEAAASVSALAADLVRAV